MTRLIMIGGFLGAGKTTTLLRLGQAFVSRGQRVGVLTNDQGEDLVDTGLFTASGFDARDIRGGCFCCRMDEFLEQATTLRSALAVDVLLAEPVGSCTDLVATVLRPLRRMHARQFDIAPFTVIVDPLRARDVLSRSGKAALPEKIAYIYKLQQMEADAIAINKIDLLHEGELAEVADLLHAQFPDKPLFHVSARTAEGFDELMHWMNARTFVDSHDSPEIDYDIYAEGEAELAWVDCTCSLAASAAIEMDPALTALGDSLRKHLAGAGIPVAHVKVLVSGGGATCALSITGTERAAGLTRRAGGASPFLDVTVNARAPALPQLLQATVDRSLDSWAATVGGVLHRQRAAAFSPPRPVPIFRESAAAGAAPELTHRTRGHL